MKTKKTQQITSRYSPKNKYSGEIRFSKALEGIGSAWGVTANELELLKYRLQFYIDLARKNKATCHIRIYENLKQYPDFDWVEIESYEA